MNDAHAMKRTRTSVLAALVALAPVALATLAPRAAAQVMAAADSRGDASGLPEGVAPWWPSRYGGDDQLGTLNEITPEGVKSATALVKRGEVVDLGRVLDDNTPKFPGRFWHQTVDVSPHFENARRIDARGRGWGRNEINWITEIQSGTFQVGTQLDAIGHLQIGDRFYNGWRTRDIVEPWGLARLGIETIPPIVTRGVLVDVARTRRTDQLPPGTVITPSDVEAALASTGVDIEPGDAVLFHTGWGRSYGVANDRYLSGEPGPGMALAQWLVERRVAVTGCDTWSFGPVPAEDPDRPFEVPQWLNTRHGVVVVENLHLAELAARQVVEFLFVVSHPKLRGATGAWVAPLAIC